MVADDEMSKETAFSPLMRHRRAGREIRCRTGVPPMARPETSACGKGRFVPPRFFDLMSACHCALEKPAVREPAHDACDKSRQCCHPESCVQFKRSVRIELRSSCFASQYTAANPLLAKTAAAWL